MDVSFWLNMSRHNFLNFRRGFLIYQFLIKNFLKTSLILFKIRLFVLQLFQWFLQKTSLLVKMNSSFSMTISKTLKAIWTDIAAELSENKPTEGWKYAKNTNIILTKKTEKTELSYRSSKRLQNGNQIKLSLNQVIWRLVEKIVKNSVIMGKFSRSNPTS